MSVGIKLARLLLKTGAYIQSLAVVVMKPDDLIEFSKQTYSRPEDIKSWSDREVVDAGLSPDEKDLLVEIPDKKGELLLLGVGGGREAIPLGRMGFQVTGVDFVPDLVDLAKKNSLERGIIINGLVQEISKLDVPGETFDVVWLSRSMYSSVPTRKRRVEMVHRIYQALKPGGYLVCQFHHTPHKQFSKRGVTLRRILAICSMGNMEYENGDMLWGNIEFLHAFSSKEEVRSEIEEGGFSILRFQTEANPIRWGVICRKDKVTDNPNG